MELITTDIGKVHVEAYSNEKIHFIAGREFKDYGHGGHI